MLEKKAGGGAGFCGERVIAEFEQLTRDAAAVQRDTLRRILSENAGVEYLQGCGLAGRTDEESFRACVPLATHADFEPYIARIADGDESPVLTASPITSISLSSGTTQGKRKYIPFNQELVKSTMQIYRTSYAFRNRLFPVEDGGRALQFIYGSRQFTTPGGLTATTATTNVYRSAEFARTMRAIQSQACSPDAVVLAAPDFAQALYCHLLCGLLRAGEVRAVSATFAHSLVLAFQTFERVWEELCHDIRRGELSESRVTDPAVRRAVEGMLAPDPARADEVARRCGELSNWYGVIPAMFPNARYVHGIMTGSMEHYVGKLRHYAGALPLVAAEYGASEGWVGANIEPEAPPESAAFTVLPNIGYFEFIPLLKKKTTCDDDDGGHSCDAEEEAAEPVGLTEVTVGERYEVVMTTFAGLYRYRLGDVVEVAGFHNATPKLKFVCRRNLMLSINIDKTSEQDLQLAVDRAAGRVLAAEKLEVVDYSSHADVSRDPGHYVVFWELNAEAVADDVMRACCDELDRAFADPGYVGSRKARAIGPLELRVLRRGTFQKVLRHYLAAGAAVSQFKSPRCVPRSNPGVLQILSGNVVKAFFSTAYDD